MDTAEFVVHTVEPGFNSHGGRQASLQALSESTSLDHFKPETRKVLESPDNFVLKLGKGFENADVSAGLVAAPCGALAAIEQLRFLKDHGLKRIEMDALHGTLAQNAKALGIDVAVGSDG